MPDFSEISPTWARAFPAAYATQFYCLVHDELEAAPGSIPISPPDQDVYVLQPRGLEWAVVCLGPLRSQPPSALLATFPTMAEAFDYAEADASKRGIPFIAPRLQRWKTGR